ncbi:hypothetical protein CEUSTIGMA_g10455.t1 [Chlamydomonas eustigma]|uniref:HIT-type domain-containing protein n=1 Tax=Chlamydomonas eustigma TaxID=1157962 RepID=A0A250XIX5_9CHLO|nr:hypothetical protein CEUSTIGMA_g10455.t1 [Chlamydomonas eustigma]|eukprot:GAX83028.1 hypothetical protein CEUSTIGMA_g10455.t1 [Chlamydomonas eustigma]
MEIERQHVVCRVCIKQYSKYVCPKCNITYCSLACFKQHSSSCTESFYRDQAVEQLKGTCAENADDKKRVLEILKRFHQQIDEDGLSTRQDGSLLNFPGTMLGDADNEEEDLDAEDVEEDETASIAQDSILSKETLGKILLKVQQSASSANDTRDLACLLDQVHLDERDLPPAELKALLSAAVTGRLSHLLPAWQPWWTTQQARDLRLGAAGISIITEISSGATHQQGKLGDVHQEKLEEVAFTAEASPLPPLPTHPLPALAALTRASPSSLLRWHVLEVMYTYCLTMAMFNGEVEGSTALEVASQILNISTCLAPPSSSTSSAALPKSHHAKSPVPLEGTSLHNKIGGQQDTSGSAAAAPSISAPSAAASSAALPPTSSTEALVGCMTRACQPPIGDVNVRPLALAALGETYVLLLLHRNGILLALHHLRTVFEAAAVELEQVIMKQTSMPPLGNKGGSKSSLWCRGRTAMDARVAPVKAQKHAFQAAARKLLFLSAWCNEQDESVLRVMLDAAEEACKDYGSDTLSSVLQHNMEGNSIEIRSSTFTSSSINAVKDAVHKNSSVPEEKTHALALSDIGMTSQSRAQHGLQLTDALKLSGRGTTKTSSACRTSLKPRHIVDDLQNLQ